MGGLSVGLAGNPIPAKPPNAVAPKAVLIGLRAIAAPAFKPAPLAPPALLATCVTAALAFLPPLATCPAPRTVPPKKLPTPPTAPLPKFQAPLANAPANSSNCIVVSFSVTLSQITLNVSGSVTCSPSVVYTLP